MHRLTAVITALLSAITLSANAFSQDVSEAEQIARTYMAHYSAVDWDAMEAMMAEDILFRDVTAQGPGYGPDGIQVDSRDEAMGLLREFAAQYNPIELGFVWEDVFESNGRVVFIGHVNAIYPTDQEDQVFRWRARQVSVITVQDGVIVRQEDFADYGGPETGLVAR